MIYNYLPAYISGKNMLPGFKGGFDSFANGVGRAIYNEMIANGWYTPARYDNIMSLLSSESGHGTSMLATKYHNYGGRKNAKGGYMHFKDDSAFAKDHLAYLQRMHRDAWNAKDTMDYVKALKASNYMGDNIYHYYNLLKGQQSARKAWNAAMKTWGLPKTEPVDATRVAKPVMEIPVLIEQPRQLQPPAYIDPTLLFNQSEEVLLPVVEDNYETSLLPSILDAMLYFLPSLTPFANNDFMSLLVLIGLPRAKYGKDALPGFELGTPPPEKTLNQNMDKVINVYNPWSDSVQQHTPYGVSEYNGALARMSIDKDGNTAWTVPMLDEVKVYRHPERNWNVQSPDYVPWSNLTSQQRLSRFEQLYGPSGVYDRLSKPPTVDVLHGYEKPLELVYPEFDVLSTYAPFRGMLSNFILNNTKKSIAGTTVGLLLRNNNNLLNNIHGIIPGESVEHVINNGAKSELVDNPLAIYVQRMYNEGFKPTNIKIARTDSDAAKIFANNIIKMRHSNNPATKIQYKTIKKLFGQDVDIDSLDENELQKLGNLLFYGEGSMGDTEGAFGGIIHYAKNADARAFKRSGYDISGIPENKAELLTLVHEWEHINGVPYNPIPEGTISKIGLGKLFDYFNDFNNTEVGARIAQILSSFGVTDKSNITGYELKKYFLKYINDPHSIPNNTKLLYNSVLDWDKLANWARNKNNVRSIIGATTIGYSASKNKK